MKVKALFVLVAIFALPTQLFAQTITLPPGGSIQSADGHTIYCSTAGNNGGDSFLKYCKCERIRQLNPGKYQWAIKRFAVLPNGQEKELGILSYVNYDDETGGECQLQQASLPACQ